MRQAAAQEVDDYISNAPAVAQAELRRLRRAIRAAVPEAEERFSYGMPYYHHHGRLAYFSVRTRHIGLHPFHPADLDVDLHPFVAGKATLRFPLGVPLPLEAITRAVRRRAERLETAQGPSRPTVSGPL